MVYITCMFEAQYVLEKGRTETSALGEAEERAVS